MNDEEATSLVNGLVFVIQKARSDLMESLGSDSEELLASLQPTLFGPDSAARHLFQWRGRCEESGVIKGSDLFNIFKWIDMGESRFILGLLGVYGYTDPQEADIAWFTQTWKYVPRPLPPPGVPPR